jgi:uncharacterized protein (DUF488 family)
MTPDRMNEDALRQHIRTRLADGTLPRQLRLSGVSYGILTDRCAVCERAQTEVRCLASEGTFAFHERCYRIWREETGQRT